MASKIKIKERILDLPKVEDARGNLSFLEESGQIPFKVARVYWIYDVPAGQKRGSHAFKTQEEIIIALSGSFDVVLNDGKESRSYQLNRAYKALYVPAKMWRTLENFATNSVCLVISSGSYDESEYIRNYRLFKQFIKGGDILSTSTIEDVPLESLQKSLSQNSTISGCLPLELPTVRSRAGNLTPVHCSVDIPFDVKRVFFVYDIPHGKTRGMHAHKRCHQFLIAASGSFDVELDDGKHKKSISINKPMQGIHVLPEIWSKEYNYSSGAICLVLASEIYTEEDYIRRYSDFKKIRS